MNHLWLSLLGTAILSFVVFLKHDIKFLYIIEPFTIFVLFRFVSPLFYSHRFSYIHLNPLLDVLHVFKNNQKFSMDLVYLICFQIIGGVIGLNLAKLF